MQVIVAFGIPFTLVIHTFMATALGSFPFMATAPFPFIAVTSCKDFALTSEQGPYKVPNVLSESTFLAEVEQEPILDFLARSSHFLLALVKPLHLAS